MTSSLFGGLGAPRDEGPVDTTPPARLGVLYSVAWRDHRDEPWRYGQTATSKYPPGGDEVVEVFEWATKQTHRFVGDEIDRLIPKPLPPKGSGRSMKRIG